MEFRWVAGLTIWTMLSGPILSQPSPPRPSAVQARTISVPPKPAPIVSPGKAAPKLPR
jgi:hypothetical protein